MNEEIDIEVYQGQPIASYSLWDLGIIYKSLVEAEKKREEASKHHKFDKKNNKKAMDFPPPNPNFLKLKNAIELEIRKKQS